MPDRFATQRDPRPELDRSSIRITEFVDQLARAGIRPAEHSRPSTPDGAQSVSVIGWGLEGCRGRRQGCGPDCVTVLTTNGHLALTSEQPPRSRWRHIRPRYLVLPEHSVLHVMLVRAGALLLPRPMTA